MKRFLPEPSAHPSPALRRAEGARCGERGDGGRLPRFGVFLKNVLIKNRRRGVRSGERLRDERHSVMGFRDERAVPHCRSSHKQEKKKEKEKAIKF